VKSSIAMLAQTFTRTIFSRYIQLLGLEPYIHKHNYITTCTAVHIWAYVFLRILDLHLLQFNTCRWSIHTKGPIYLITNILTISMHLIIWSLMILHHDYTIILWMLKEYVQCILGYPNTSVPSSWEKCSGKWICSDNWIPLIYIQDFL